MSILRVRVSTKARLGTRVSLIRLAAGVGWVRVRVSVRVGVYSLSTIIPVRRIIRVSPLFIYSICRVRISSWSTGGV